MPSFSRTILPVAILLLAQAGWAAEPRPNILIILSDDQTYHDLGCYGNEDVHTPHLDRLASQGMRFTHCFTATAMCAPTRQQLYTGVFPVRNGAYPNHSRVYDGTKSMVHHLKALGYRVGLSGKRHFGPASSFPFEKVKNKQEFIEQDKSQPYCLVVTSHSPHLPWTAGDASQYDPQELRLPPYFVDTPETRKSLTQYYAEITDFDREVGECMKLVEKSGAEENTIFLYTSEQGAQFPRCKWTCYDTGLRTALIVRWPKRVKAGTVSRALVQYVDILPTLLAAAGGEPAKIDTGLPGAPDGGRGFDGRSFLPVLEGERDEHNEFVYGVHTTRGIINGSRSYPIRSVRTRTHKLIWNLQHDAAFQNVLIGGRDRGGYWGSWVEKAQSDPQAKRFVEGYQRRPEFELYDLTKDPYELHNLAGAAAQAELQQQLLAQLKDWMKQQGDAGIETELTAKKRQGKK